MAGSVVGFFGDERAAEVAMQELADAGFQDDDVWLEREARALRVIVRTDATRSARAAEILRRHEPAA